MKLSPRIVCSKLVASSHGKKWLAALLLTSATLCASAAHAQLLSGTISVDFNSTAGGATIAPTQNAIVTPGTFNPVNAGGNVAVNASGIALVDSTGASSNVSMAYTANGSYNVDPYLSTAGKMNSPNLGLLEDFVLSSSTTAPSTVTLSGLSLTTTYNLYLYAGGNINGRQTIFTLNGVSQTASYSDADTAFVNGHNYVPYLGIAPTGTGATGSITFTYAASTMGTGTEGNLAGFQIQAIPATGVPEPASVTLLVLGGGAAVGGVMRSRRSQKVG